MSVLKSIRKTRSTVARFDKPPAARVAPYTVKSSPIYAPAKHSVIILSLVTVQASLVASRCLGAAAARAWNTLPQQVQDAPSLPVFRRELKTVLFQSSFRPTNNMSRAVYQRRTVTCLATLTESDCTVVLQQKCDNATLIIFISTTTTLSGGKAGKPPLRLKDNGIRCHNSVTGMEFRGLVP